MLRALREYLIEGVRTNLPFLEWIVAHPEFVAGRTHTRFVEEHFRPEHLHRPEMDELAAAIAAVAAHRDRMVGGAAHRPGPSPGGAKADPFAPHPSAWRARGWR